MKELFDPELMVDELPEAEATDEGSMLYFIHCPYCGEEHSIEILCPDKYEKNNEYCSCGKWFKSEYLPDDVVGKILITK